MKIQLELTTDQAKTLGIHSYTDNCDARQVSWPEEKYPIYGNDESDGSDDGEDANPLVTVTYDTNATDFWTEYFTAELLLHLTGEEQQFKGVLKNWLKAVPEEVRGIFHYKFSRDNSNYREREAILIYLLEVLSEQPHEFALENLNHFFFTDDDKAKTDSYCFMFLMQEILNNQIPLAQALISQAGPIVDERIAAERSEPTTDISTRSHPPITQFLVRGVKNNDQPSEYHEDEDEEHFSSHIKRKKKRLSTLLMEKCSADLLCYPNLILALSSIEKSLLKAAIGESAFWDNLPQDYFDVVCGVLADNHYDKTQVLSIAAKELLPREAAWAYLFRNPTEFDKLLMKVEDVDSPYSKGPAFSFMADDNRPMVLGFIRNILGVSSDLSIFDVVRQHMGKYPVGTPTGPQQEVALFFYLFIANVNEKGANLQNMAPYLEYVTRDQTTLLSVIDALPALLRYFLVTLLMAPYRNAHLTYRLFELFPAAIAFGSEGAASFITDQFRLEGENKVIKKLEKTINEYFASCSQSYKLFKLVQASSPQIMPNTHVAALEDRVAVLEEQLQTALARFEEHATSATTAAQELTADVPETIIETAADTSTPPTESTQTASEALTASSSPGTFAGTSSPSEATAEEDSYWSQLIHEPCSLL